MASVALIGVEARHAAFQGDEWSYAFRLARQPLLPAVFDPPYGSYLIAFPMLIYTGLLKVFGLGSYLPYRIVGLGLLLAAVAIFFELVRRRVGALTALPMAILLLFFGSGSEVVAVPTRMPGQVALTAGLGMLIALERRDLRGDVVACLLLFIALGSHPLGLAFAAAALTSLALRPAGERLRRWWVVVPPIALFALWWVTLHGSFPGSTNPSIGEVLSFAANSFVATCGAAAGLFRAPWTSDADFINPLSVALTIAFVIAIVARLIYRPASATMWVALAALAAALVAPGLAPGGFLANIRQPDASRYLYPNTFLLFLVGAEAIADIKFSSAMRRAILTAALAIFAVSLISNVRLLIDRANGYGEDGSLLRAKLAGAELARSRSASVVPTDPDWEAANLQLAFSIGIPAPMSAAALAAYYTVNDAYGTPAYSQSELRSAPEDLQRVAADELQSALKLNGGPKAPTAP
ncbi:MAG TPA: hypothetical protein VH391_07015 [Solirubrobacterales bacterium]